MSKLTYRHTLLVAACLLALALAGFGIYGLSRSPKEAARHESDASPSRDYVVVPPVAARVTLTARSLPQTTDPIAYARAIALLLFDWDTSAGFLPTDYTAAVLADADPSGEETPGLLSDVSTYLPTTEQWVNLGAMEVEQSIDIDHARIPDSWASALDQSHGSLRPGTTAVTVEGIRHRRGIWNGKAAASSNRVAFTVFIACRPSFDRCHILRLSALNNPLR